MPKQGQNLTVTARGVVMSNLSNCIIYYSCKVTITAMADLFISSMSLD